MAAEWIEVVLRGWIPNGVVGTQLFELLHASEGYLRVKVGEARDEASYVYLVDEAVASYAQSPEPWGAFATAIGQSLLRAAAWLDGRPSSAFETCRERGLSMDVFVGSWIDQDQFDLDLPAPFLLACGRAGLDMSIVTND